MELNISEGRICGSRYYTVEPPWGTDWGAMEKWTFETMGWPGAVPWKETEQLSRWYKNGRKFWFKEKKDLEWFVLKWA